MDLTGAALKRVAPYQLFGNTVSIRIPVLLISQIEKIFDIIIFGRLNAHVLIRVGIEKCQMY